MTTDKARKRAVRTRMTKTGERYAAARRHVVGDRPTHAGAGSPVPADQVAAATLPVRVADPGMSETAIRDGTGRGWDEWFRILDDWDATTHRHPEIAAYLREEHGVSGWWAQGVTVGYERARGLRAVHETSRGFEVSVSKTIAASAPEVWDAVIDAPERDTWLAPGALRRRTGTGVRHRSARFDVVADGSRVLLTLTPKDDGRTTVTITNERLPGAEAIEAARVGWRAGLARLAERFAADRGGDRVATRRRRSS